jgi:flagellar basal-body rod protein FlgB
MANFVENLLSRGGVPVLEQVLRFTGRRHRLLAENIANVDTPGYIHRDLSVPRFERALRQRIEQRERMPVGRVSFADIPLVEREAPAGLLAPDRNNRSMEQLAADLARNALLYNVAAELLRKQFQQLDMALKERVV